MSNDRNAVFNFNTETSIMGIPVTSLITALMLSMPIYLFLQNMIPEGRFKVVIVFLSWVGISYGVILKLVLFINKKLPKNYLKHLMDWLRTSNQYFPDIDRTPLPPIITTERQKNKIENIK